MKANLVSYEPGYGRASGVDDYGNAWIEYDIEPSCRECECDGPECEPTSCPRFVDECHACGNAIERSGWLCLDGGDQLCHECVILPHGSESQAQKRARELAEALKAGAGKPGAVPGIELGDLVDTGPDLRGDVLALAELFDHGNLRRWPAGGYGAPDAGDDCVTYGRAEPLRSYHRLEDVAADELGLFAEVPYCGGSDYSGSLVERSNFRAWSEEYAAGKGTWWWELCGGHSTFGVLVSLNRLAELDAAQRTGDDENSVGEQVRETLRRLDNYPLLDEDLHSQLECEAQDEAWACWAKSEFRRALEAALGIEDLELEDDALFSVFHQAADDASEYWVNEQGSEMHIDVDAVAREVTLEDLDDAGAKWTVPEEAA